MYKTLAHIGGIVVVVGVVCYGLFLGGRYIIGSIVVGELDKVNIYNRESFDFRSIQASDAYTKHYEEVETKLNQIKSSWGY